MPRLGVDERDVLAVVAGVSLLYGVSRWSDPAAWVLVGALLLLVAVWPYTGRRGAGAGIPPVPGRGGGGDDDWQFSNTGGGGRGVVGSASGRD